MSTRRGRDVRSQAPQRMAPHHPAAHDLRRGKVLPLSCRIAPMPLQPKCRRRVSDHRIDSIPISAPRQATADDRRATGISNPQKPSPIAPPGLWDAATGTFHGALLRRAIVARGWTVRDFAGQARLNICSVYNAMHGKPVRDGTTIRIFEALEKRAPMLVVLDREGSGR